MRLHRLPICFQLAVLLIGGIQLIGGEKTKAKSFFSDDSSEFKGGDPPLYFPPPAQDSWSVEFPKDAGGFASNEDNSFETNKYDDEDDEFYQRPGGEYLDSSHGRPEPYRRPFGYSTNKKPYEEDYDSPANSYEHHDYDNFEPSYATGHNKNADHHKNFNQKPSYSKPSAEPVKYDTKYDDRYPVNKPYNGKPYIKPYNNGDKPYNDKPYNSKPYANRLTCYDREETCTPLNRCPINIRFDDYEAIQKCTLSDNSDGVCCPPPELPTPRGEACAYIF